MYKIEKKSYGYKLTFDGLIKEDEMKRWVEDSDKALSTAPSSFGVLIDMRTLKPISPQTQKHMQDGQKLYKTKGMAKSAVILSSSITKMQFKKIAKETGIYEWERYIDASSDSNWEKTATDWIVNGIDPDK